MSSSLQAPVAIVQSVHEAEVREINALETRIFEAEEDADEKLWEQARLVVEQLDAGLSQRALAQQWINARTGEAYSQSHVVWTVKTFEQFTVQPRPRFRDAYNAIANKSKVHVSQATGENEWYTPSKYIEAARAVLGEIDLDPASSAEANTVVRAARFYSRIDDGLVQSWRGRVWMNPPYAQPLVNQFCDKFVESLDAGTVTAGVVLVNNATETGWFSTLLARASAVCFPLGRVRFCCPSGEEGAPLQGQAILYCGAKPDLFCEQYRPFGAIVLVVR